MMSASEAVAARVDLLPLSPFRQSRPLYHRPPRGLPHDPPFRMNADTPGFPSCCRNGDIWNKRGFITIRMSKEFYFSVVFSWGGVFVELRSGEQQPD